jgi:demethylmacrocin O-methyltransferase
VSPGGLYVIEDLETAYDEDYGGGVPGTPGTAMSLLKELLDAAQHEADWPNVDGVAVHHGIGFVSRTG